uniref:Uncharacterized protein n=1 Tax=Anopheles epiroticus TaxID=199890 RepID=A0A182PKV7_9DIPT
MSSDTVCRLCLIDMVPDECGSSVLDVPFQQALEAVFKFKITFKAGLPGYTCQRCSWNVLDFQSYSEIVKSNQEKLEEHWNTTDLSSKSFSEDSFYDDEQIKERSTTMERLNSPDIGEKNDHREFVTGSTGQINQREVEHGITLNCADATTSLVNRGAKTLTSVMVCGEYAQFPACVNSETEAFGDTKTLERQHNKKHMLRTKEGLIVTDENKHRKNNTANNKRKRSNIPTSEKDDSELETHESWESRKYIEGQEGEFYRCEHCGKLLTSEWQYNYHQRKHST